MLELNIDGVIFKNETKITCTICDQHIDNAMLFFDGLNWFILQNKNNGFSPVGYDWKEYGYKYGWNINSGSELILKRERVYNIKKIKTNKLSNNDIQSCMH